ncbi:predicted protein [Streptomyces viridosporus ATCC 14672]|uniref:Predicted protein n=1 Tax=Streptomyces viridosporus (strain ATCC 14672 / DSM 40746 / JCM 4963 / KCTC 9882 / NRRL B-12104 / FH 1290) TaxID=566461 RepID=D6AAU2_STRV1|nr:hypothetical protein [Streptomyces viridosporus]EFE72627.1 predicted protein [Streptomyces viridosporus ATCC 14672]
MSRRPPLGASAVWQAVMEPAGYRCQCSGACGSQHAKTGMRCHRTAGSYRLIVAPADLLLSPAAAAAVPAEQLLAWCPDCHRAALGRQRAAERERRRLEDPEPAGLFDL